MILLRDACITGHRARPLLGPFSAELGAGAFAFVGPSEEGGPLLLSVLAGATKLRSGVVQVLGAAPQPRPETAWVPLASELFPNHSVAELLTLAARLHGEPTSSPAQRLQRFGLEALAARRAADLDAVTVHTVALVLAITSKASVLLLEEPLARVDARAAAPLVDAIRERAEHGATVVITTASVRDARALGASTFFPNPSSWWKSSRELGDPLRGAGAMRVMGADLRALAAALAADERASTLTWRGSDLIVAGSDLIEVARAVGERAVATAARIELMEPTIAPARNEERAP